ncbi:hypothetical protein [Aeromicrobium duanguangcaii]|uniref:Uncharacterized protein n=1 Tax=Aeromicrobium duanguangcaii TaxID=2968086 RepID=A0ABY5KLN8_9ACTN|nr:hypothetical protein [Aeromicrobium duanguangcaii]MCD9152939.1 hypothetical protein [Aeromicrobium duanguangcaii]UUI69955.1 hypothetical protein NP095_07630 [Aeromicrobium duanguangcaii]
MGSHRRGITADELQRDMEARYRNDPAYRAQVDRVETEHQARSEELRRAERPLIEELRSAGVLVSSVWQLYAHPDKGEVAFPILRRHLLLDYPDRILEGIARGFTRQAVRQNWAQLLEIYLRESRPPVRDGLAATLSMHAVRAHYEDLIGILENEALGETRIYFLRPVNLIGNRMEPGRGRQVVAQVAADPQLVREATAILQGRDRNR